MEPKTVDLNVYHFVTMPMGITLSGLGVINCAAHSLEDAGAMVNTMIKGKRRQAIYVGKNNAQDFLDNLKLSVKSTEKETSQKKITSLSNMAAYLKDNGYVVYKKK